MKPVAPLWPLITEDLVESQAISFVVEKVTFGKISFWVLSFSSVRITPPVPHALSPAPYNLVIFSGFRVVLIPASAQFYL
jgi:hypothetical protein